MSRIKLIILLLLVAWGVNYGSPAIVSTLGRVLDRREPMWVEVVTSTEEIHGWIDKVYFEAFLRAEEPASFILVTSGFVFHTIQSSDIYLIRVIKH